MERLTFRDVIDAAGEEEIYQVGDITQNRYFMRGHPIPKWINEKLYTAHYLGLDKKQKPKKILDIGTGAGWFPFICNMYGHDCIGSDVPGRPEYEPGYQLLKIKTSPMLVYPMKPMEIDGKFDYITTMRSFFPQRPRAWEKDEWKFFLADAREHLNPTGALFLATNSGSKLDKKYKNLPLNERSHWGALELEEWFKPYMAVPDNPNDKTLYITHTNIQKLLDS